jgi:hypothetical protein
MAEPTLREQALALYKPPFRFQMGYIFDGAGKMVADQDGFDGKVQEAVIARVRGWGRISYLPDAEKLQDEVGAMLADALNAFYAHRTEAPQQDGQRSDVHPEFSGPQGTDGTAVTAGVEKL